MSKRNVYALLIGINEYPIPHHRLHGCVGDMEVMKEYIEGRFNKEDYDLHIQTLKDQEATRQAVIDGFLNHLTQAQENDIVFIHYSGHGSQIPAAPEFAHLEPDGLEETMVCWDSRLPDGKDLTGKERSYLIWKVAQNNPHIILLIDSCHSGNSTKETDTETMSRMAEQGNVGMKLEEYVGYEEYENRNGNIFPPVGDHILLAACQDQETAKETNMGGVRGGVFTHSLLNTLKESKGGLSYQDLMTRVQTKVYNTVNEQHPQLETVNEADKLKSFLDGAILPKPDYYTVAFDNVDGWIIDAGALHGIPMPIGMKTTKLALFDEGASNADMANIDNAIGTLEVIDVFPSRSAVRIDGVAEDTSKVYKSKITEIPIPALKVTLDLTGDAEGIQLAKEALTASKSHYLEVSEDPKDAKYRILAKGNQYYVTHPGDEKPLFKRIDGYTADNATMLTQNLEQIAKWENTSMLNNPHTNISSDAIGITFTEVLEIQAGNMTKEQEVDTSEIVSLSYKYNELKRKWEAPRYRVKVTNNSDEQLYFCASTHQL